VRGSTIFVEMLRAKECVVSIGRDVCRGAAGSWGESSKLKL
jgi:hypothetical protein